MRDTHRHQGLRLQVGDADVRLAGDDVPIGAVSTNDVLLTALVDIGLSVSAFAILGGALLGLYFARPVQQLAEVVQRLNAGDIDVRALVQGDDEITYLAENLNSYLDTLSKENKRPEDA